jgi:hypothetical protein
MSAATQQQKGLAPPLNGALRDPAVIQVLSAPVLFRLAPHCCASSLLEYDSHLPEWQDAYLCGASLPKKIDPEALVQNRSYRTGSTLGKRQRPQ